jgi:RND family efflux transporter MFP subunit
VPCCLPPKASLGVRLALALVAAGACAAAAFAQTRPPPATPANDEPPLVVVRPLSDIAIRQQATAPADVRSLNEARIAPEIAAPIVEINARPGEMLARGAIVARLDPRDYEIALERARAGVEAARARLKLAQAQLERSRTLAQQSFISSEALNQRETELDVVRADLRVQEAQLASAERSLAKTTLRSPFRAIVASRTGSVGEIAQPGAPLATLVDADRIEVVANVPARDAETLRTARDVAFVTPDAKLPVALARLSPAIERESRTVEARLTFAGGRAPVGSTGRIVWTPPRNFVPPELLVRRSEGFGVFVVDGDVARFVALADAQEGRPAATDLPPGTRIVVDGHRALQPGRKVSLAPAPPGAR